MNAAHYRGHDGFGRRSSRMSILAFLALGAFLTALVYATGASQSPLLVLYLPLVMASALVLGQKSALAIAGLYSAAYAVLLFALGEGWLRTWDSTLSLGAPRGGLLLQEIGLSSAMVLVAIATAFLRRAVRTREEVIRQSRLELRNLSQKHKELVDSISTGLITTDLDGVIVSINQAASAVLGVTEDKACGAVLDQVMKNADAQADERREHLSNGESRGELEIKQADGTALRIIYHGRDLCTESACPSGRIFVFQDVTHQRSIEEQLELQERMARLLARREEPASRSRSKFSELVGESPVMLKVYNLIEKVAPSDATVLVHGESGTGKELVARSIHFSSDRAKQPFVPVNCGAIPENLIESQLFGHRKGSFTGAVSDYEGFFEQADRGTIFLDEVGDLPMTVQVKLLRAIQERRVRPVGGERDVPVDVRIVAATNKKLRQLVEDGLFREDLYYRLNVISINLPPLRDRKEDLPLLVDSLLRKFVNGGRQAMVPPQTMQMLRNYNYPGNVRELENILERAFVLGGEIILPDHLPDTVRHAQPITVIATPEQQQQRTTIIIDESLVLPCDLDTILAALERRYLEAALGQTQGAKKKAAELLGMNFRSFRYRCQKFGLGAGD